MWDMAEDAKALVRDLIDRHKMPVTLYPGVAHACRTGGEVKAAHAYAERLRRDYGYDRTEPLDRAGIRALIGSDATRAARLTGARAICTVELCIGLAAAAAKAGAHIHERSEVHHIRHGAKTCRLHKLGQGDLRSSHSGRQRLSRRAGAEGGGARDAHQ